MPIATTITLNDGQATPVAHDFDPRRRDPEGSVFVNGDSATSAGAMSLVIGLSSASANRRTDKGTVRFAMPVEDTVDGITSVRGIARHRGENVLPDDLTTQERADFYAYVSNLYASAAVSALLKDLNPQY